MKKVSFDFDSTLEFQSIQDYAKKLIEEGIEVHIVTSRFEDCSKYQDNRDGHLNHDFLFKVANKIGIKKENIHFTNFEDKWIFFKDKNFIWHLDDDNLETLMINTNTKTKGIWSLRSGDFRYQCNKLLNMYQDE